MKMNFCSFIHPLGIHKIVEQEGFLRCQTPASTVRLKVEGRRVKNGWGVVGWRVKNRGCRIES